MSAGEGQRPREAAISSAAGEVFRVQIGRQAVGIPRPAAGEAGVMPGTIGLAGKRSGLAVPSRQALGKLVQVVARTRLRVSLVAIVFLSSVQPPSTKRGALSGGGGLWKDAPAIEVRGGVWLVDNAGFSLRFAHGLIVLFRQVMVAAQVAAQLAHVTHVRNTVIRTICLDKYWPTAQRSGGTAVSLD